MRIGSFSLVFTGVFLFCPLPGHAEIWRCDSGGGSYKYVNNLELAANPDSCTKPNLPELGRYNSIRALSGLQKSYGAKTSSRKRVTENDQFAPKQDPFYDEGPHPAPFVMSPRERRKHAGKVNDYRHSHYQDLEAEGLDSGQTGTSTEAGSNGGYEQFDGFQLYDLDGAMGSQSHEEQLYLKQFDPQELMHTVEGLSRILGGNNSNMQQVIQQIQERDNLFDAEADIPAEP